MLKMKNKQNVDSRCNPVAKYKNKRCHRYKTNGVKKNSLKIH